MVQREMAGDVAMAESPRASRVTCSQEVCIVNLRAMGNHRRAVCAGTAISLVFFKGHSGCNGDTTWEGGQAGSRKDQARSSCGNRVRDAGGLNEDSGNGGRTEKLKDLGTEWTVEQRREGRLRDISHQDEN